jgi:hypothetical protein
MEEFHTWKRGHLIDILKPIKGGGEKIATYNCKKDTLILYKATFNKMITNQLWICASLMQMKSEYEEEIKC